MQRNHFNDLNAVLLRSLSSTPIIGVQCDDVTEDLEVVKLLRNERRLDVRTLEIAN